MNRLFYIIYNSYYKHGEYEDDIPNLTVGGIFTASFFCFSLSIVNMLGWFNPLYRAIHISNLSGFFLVILSLLIVYFLFYHNKRYRKIYETYKEDTFLNSKGAKYLGFFIVILIILSPFILALVQNKIFHGYWV